MLPPILARKEALGYPVFHGQYDLNIVGIRKRNGTANAFDDLICIAYRNTKEWRVHCMEGTTDPGLYWLEHPSNIKGTAILCPGHYPGIWEIDLHRQKCEALCQRSGPVKVWRDADRDGELDVNGETDEGFFGINLHKAGRSSTRVDRWSAGCQVVRNQSDFNTLMKLANLQISTTGCTTFSYTLLDEWQ